jgi:hypothetical protein
MCLVNNAHAPLESSSAILSEHGPNRSCYSSGNAAIDTTTRGHASWKYTTCIVASNCVHRPNGSTSTILASQTMPKTVSNRVLCRILCRTLCRQLWRISRRIHWRKPCRQLCRQLCRRWWKIFANRMSTTVSTIGVDENHATYAVKMRRKLSTPNVDTVFDHLWQHVRTRHDSRMDDVLVSRVTCAVRWHATPCNAS